MLTKLIKRTGWLMGLLLTGSPLVAQQLTATPGSTGIYLATGKQLPKTFRYRIDRSPAGRGAWQPLTELYYPRVASEFVGRLNEAITQLPPSHVQFPKQSLAIARYNLLKNSQTVDSLQTFSVMPHYQIAAGVGFWDATATPNTAYDYRLIRLGAGRPGESAASTTAPAAAGESAVRNVQYPGSYPATTLETDTLYADGPTVTIEYRLNGGRPPDVLDLYRAYYLRGAYEQVPASVHPVGMKNGYLHYKVTDAGVTDKLAYAYYVVPGDYFGNRGTPSTVRNVYNARQNEVTALVSQFRVTSVPKVNGLRLSWRIPPSRQVTSVDIFRGDNFDKTFVRLTSVGVTDTVYIDHSVEPVRTYFYSIVVNTVYGKAYPSARVPGLLEGTQPNNHPPAVFTGTQHGRVVTLRWQQPDRSIYGYYLYRTNRHEDPKPQQIGTIVLSRDSVVTVTDTLPDKGAGPWIYAAASVNTSYNISALSQRATFQGNATVQPPPNLTVRLRDNRVAHLIWTSLSQRGQPTGGYQVYRKETDETGTLSDWKLLPRQPTGPEANFYADSALVPGRSYRYAVRTVGLAGQFSDFSSEAGCTVVETFPASVRNVRALLTGKAVLLQWDSPFDPAIERLVVYRAETGQAFQRLKEVDHTTTEFSDTAPQGKRTYYYRIVSEDRRKQQSRNTDTVGIYIE